MNVKNVMSIQYPAPGFEPTTFGNNTLKLFNYLCLKKWTLD